MLYVTSVELFTASIPLPQYITVLVHFEQGTNDGSVALEA